MSATTSIKSPPPKSLACKNIMLAGSTPHDPFFITIGSTNNATTKTLNTGNSLSKLSFTAATERVLPMYSNNIGGSNINPPGCSRKPTKDLPPKEERKERIAVLLESNGNRFIRQRLNFDSPRTSEAAAQLGITFEDCLKRYSIF